MGMEESKVGKSLRMEEHMLLLHKWIQDSSHLQHIEMVCGQPDNDVVSALVLAVVPSRGLEKKIALTFQRYVILDAQTIENFKIKDGPWSRKLQT